MPKWHDRWLDELCSISSGESLPAHEQNGQFPLMGANGQIGKASKANFTDGFLVGRVGAAGEISTISSPCWASDNTLTIRPKTKVVSTKFLAHALRNLNLASIATKTAQPLLTQSQLKKQLLHLPESAIEQETIAQILDTLDTQIQKTEALIVKLEKIKEGLLHDLLTRGIDQNGELRPTPEQAPELYKESALGLIPKEWGLAHVSEIGAVITGSTPPSSDLNAWGGVHRFFTPADVKDSEPLDHTERTISDSGTRYVRLIPAEATLVVCIGSTIGKVGITSCPGATNQQINAVIPSNLWSPTFVFQAIRQHVYQIHAWAGLQAVPIVNKSTFQKMLIPKPSGQEQCRISDAVKKLEARATMERAIFEKLNKQKIALTDDLLTGRVRVTPLLPSS